MFGKDLLIKKCPYLGFSPNLIEYFAIVGYQDNFIPQLIDLLENSKTPNSENPYSPTILSSVTSSTDYGIVDNELIKSQLYPSNPNIILVDPVNKQTPENSSVIYSMCFDSSDGTQKLFYACYAFLFYELYTYQKNKITNEYYIPKAFCIISQFPFFNTFNIICNNLYNIYSQKNNNIPLELNVYNILNYIPSPINYNLCLSIFNDDNIVANINQLSGYPYIDFDLNELFAFFPINFILEIFLLTVLEQPILFFSSNLENLNMVMYIMYILNYPCNDSTYFWHIVSVSKKNVTEENKFVGKIMVSLLGVNSAYDDSIDTFAFGRYHYIVDIDNKKLKLREALDLSMDERDEINRIIELQEYLENILNEKSVESYFLKKHITTLKNNLQNIIVVDKSSYSYLIQKRNMNFFTQKKINHKLNKSFQEYFYDFYLKILLIFYNDNNLNNSFDKIEKEDVYQKDNNKYAREELIFNDVFRSSVKYKIYFDNFMKEFDVMDTFKIPLIVSEIFLSLKIRDEKEITSEKIKYFSLIDQLYLQKKNDLLTINFKFIIKEYNKKLHKKYFKAFFKIDSDIKCPVLGDIVNITNVPKKNNKLINMNKKVIDKYIYILKNKFDQTELFQAFPQILSFSKKNYINSNEIDRRFILQTIKEKFDKNNSISNLNYIIYSLVYIVSLVIPLHPYNKMMNYLIEISEYIPTMKFFLRENIYTLMKSIYKFYLEHCKTKKYPTMTLSQVKMYLYILAAAVRAQNIVPNEEMMAILARFFGHIIFQERNDQNKKDEENNINNNSTTTKMSEEENNSKINNSNQNNIDINDKNNVILFLKNCFDGYGIKSNKVMIDYTMSQPNESNVIIHMDKKDLHPAIVIKIFDYVYKCPLFYPKKIYKVISNIFEDLFDNYDLNLSYLDVGKIREVILNLIQYEIILDPKKKISVFLMDTLYLLKNFEEEYRFEK